MVGQGELWAVPLEHRLQNDHWKVKSAQSGMGLTMTQQSWAVSHKPHLPLLSCYHTDLGYQLCPEII